VDQFFPAVYEQMRRIAARQLRSERPGHTLSTTGLVHEAWLELAKLDRLHWKSRGHFLAVAAQAMRRVLIDYAVARRAQKRGSGVAAEPLTSDPMQVVSERADDLVALDEALERLLRLDARQGRIVECRFYGGLSVEETAEALGISPATVKREWALARAWLNRELRG
jgi:RNA polymerase sigma-70 factor, ECF subfamily